MKASTGSDTPAPGVNRLTNFIEGTLGLAVLGLVVGLVLRFGEGDYEYRGTPDNPCRYVFSASECIKGHNWEWTVGSTMAEVSLTYLIIVGGIYGLVRVLGGGRFRGFLKWFWRGE